MKGFIKMLWGRSSFHVATAKQQEIWSHIFCFFAGWPWATWSQRRKGMMIFMFLCGYLACVLIHYSWLGAEQMTTGLHMQFACFLQGSVLQIQGPRGFKGSKGDAVRPSGSFSHLSCCSINWHSSRVTWVKDIFDNSVQFDTTLFILTRANALSISPPRSEKYAHNT